MWEQMSYEEKLEFNKKHGLDEQAQLSVIDCAENDIEMILDKSIDLSISDIEWMKPALSELGQGKLYWMLVYCIENQSCSNQEIKIP